MKKTKIRDRKKVPTVRGLALSRSIYPGEFRKYRTFVFGSGRRKRRDQLKNA